MRNFKSGRYEVINIEGYKSSFEKGKVYPLYWDGRVIRTRSKSMHIPNLRRIEYGSIIDGNDEIKLICDNRTYILKEVE